jgi:hypothetical protein
MGEKSTVNAIWIMFVYVTNLVPSQPIWGELAPNPLTMSSKNNGWSNFDNLNSIFKIISLRGGFTKKKS